MNITIFKHHLFLHYQQHVIVMCFSSILFASLASKPIESSKNSRVILNKATLPHHPTG